MRIASVAAMLLACTEATSTEAHTKSDDDKHDTQLAQSISQAFQMDPPKLMNTGDLPAMLKNGACPSPGQKLTSKGTGKAFLDGCYMNTTRTIGREEAPGNEAQSYLYMWKHSCAFTKWVPSNQFMYSNLDYDEDTMTLERFGFIGMDKKCFWGSIGVLWKRPLPVEQILPNATLISESGTKPHPPIVKPIKKKKPIKIPVKKPIKKPIVKKPIVKKPIVKLPIKKPIVKKPIVKKPIVKKKTIIKKKVQAPPKAIKLPNKDSRAKYQYKWNIESYNVRGSVVEVQSDDWKTFTLAKGKKKSKAQQWRLVDVYKKESIVSFESVLISDKYWESYEVNATDGSGKSTYHVRTKQGDKNEWKKMGTAPYRDDPWSLFRLHPVQGKSMVFAIESVKFPGYYWVDPGVMGKPGFELRQSDNIFTENWGMFRFGRA